MLADLTKKLRRSRGGKIIYLPKRYPRPASGFSGQPGIILAFNRHEPDI
jgi:hypothetical protein